MIKQTFFIFFIFQIILKKFPHLCADESFLKVHKEFHFNIAFAQQYF